MAARRCCCSAPRLLFGLSEGRRRDAPGWRTALHGAFLLARGRPDGLLLIAAPPEAEMAVASRSFWAMAVCLPAFLCLHFLDWAGDGLPPEPVAGLALDLLGYVIGWVGFALLSHRLAGTLGRATLWPRFIAAWNWCNVVQYTLLLSAGLVSLLGFARVAGADGLAGGGRLGAVGGVVCDAAGAGDSGRSGGGAGGARFRARAVPGGDYRHGGVTRGGLGGFGPEAASGAPDHGSSRARR